MKKILASLAVLGVLTACGPVSTYYPGNDPSTPPSPNPSPTSTITPVGIPHACTDTIPPSCTP